MIAGGPQGVNGAFLGRLTPLAAWPAVNRRRKTSGEPLVSAGTRLDASDVNATPTPEAPSHSTGQPSDLVIEASYDAPLAATWRSLAEARNVVPASAASFGDGLPSVRARSTWM